MDSDGRRSEGRPPLGGGEAGGQPGRQEHGKMRESSRGLERGTEGRTPPGAGQALGKLRPVGDVSLSGCEVPLEQV